MFAQDHLLIVLILRSEFQQIPRNLIGRSHKF